MFNRPYIKGAAKQQMAGRIGIAIAASVIAMILGGGQIRNLSGFSINYNEEGISYKLNPLLGPYLTSMTFLSLALVALIYFALVGNVISIGARGWFLRYWRGEDAPISGVFAGFRSYSNFVTTGLLRDVYVFLWSLLFIIPGIVMSYAYSMADYIICEYPHLSASQALDLSKRITYGYKGDLFIFDFSFLGWQLLSAFTCGILGIVYVNPYIFTAHAGVYETLKFNALQRGVVRPEDFGMMAPPPYPPYHY